MAAEERPPDEIRRYWSRGEEGKREEGKREEELRA